MSMCVWEEITMTVLCAQQILSNNTHTCRDESWHKCIHAHVYFIILCFFCIFFESKKKMRNCEIIFTLNCDFAIFFVFSKDLCGWQVHVYTQKNTSQPVCVCVSTVVPYTKKNDTKKQNKQTVVTSCIVSYIWNKCQNLYNCMGMACNRANWSFKYFNDWIFYFN